MGGVSADVVWCEQRPPAFCDWVISIATQIEALVLVHMEPSGQQLVLLNVKQAPVGTFGVDLFPTISCLGEV